MRQLMLAMGETANLAILTDTGQCYLPYSGRMHSSHSGISISGPTARFADETLAILVAKWSRLPPMPLE